MFSVTIIYYTPAPYGPAQNIYARVHLNADTVKKIARNFESVDIWGVTHLVIDTDLDLIVQVSGYSEVKGLFCDVIPLSQLEPFLPDGYSPASRPTHSIDMIRNKYQRIR